MSRLGKLAAVVSLLLFARDPAAVRADDPPRPDDARRQALERFQGTWQLVHAESDGKSAPGDRVAQTRVTIKDSTHTVRFGDTVIVDAVPFVFDPTTTPPSTEDTVKTADGEKKIRGIYNLAGDVFVSCVGPSDGDRPTEFKAPAGSGRTLRVFRRLGSEEQEAAIAAELPRFEGTWAIESQAMKGQTLTAADLRGTQLVIEPDGHFVVVVPEGKLPGVFAVSPGASPKRIDIVLLGGNKPGNVVQGLYRLEGDTLTESVTPGGSERPSTMTSPAATDTHILQVLKRQPPP
jgi:uncharacterized protein (TIGR03067 family)